MSVRNYKFNINKAIIINVKNYNFNTNKAIRINVRNYNLDINKAIKIKNKLEGNDDECKNHDQEILNKAIMTKVFENNGMSDKNYDHEINKVIMTKRNREGDDDAIGEKNVKK